MTLLTNTENPETLTDKAYKFAAKDNRVNNQSKDIRRVFENKEPWRTQTEDCF